MLADGIVAPDGKFWYVPLPDGHDRAIFYRPSGTTWLLYCFARNEQDAKEILASISFVNGTVETAIVALAKLE